MANCCYCCTPIIVVTGVTVNTTTNIAMLALSSTLPTMGKFRLIFPNNGEPLFAQILTPYTNPQAIVNMSYTPASGTATTYTSVYQTANYQGPVCLGSLVKKARLNRFICGATGSDNIVFITDRLPLPNVSYTTTTTT